jgi:hypothetical protein
MIMQTFTIIGLLTISMMALPITALAKDHHNDRNQRDAYQNSRHYDQHAGHNKHASQRNKKIYYSGQVSHNDNRYKRYSKHNNHNVSVHKYYDQKDHRTYKHHGYNHQPYVHGYYLRRNGLYYSRQSHFVDDYFAILGGTILINELLYHSHEHR